MELKIPSKDFVLERMQQVVPEPVKVDVDIPEGLLATGNNWKYDLYGNKTIKMPPMGQPWPEPELNDKYEMPPLWGLRPRRYANMEELLLEIAALPLDTESPRKFWSVGRRGEKRGYHIPQVINETAKPFGCFYLKPDKEDSIILDGKIVGKASHETFAYRGRQITPRGEKWDVSGVSPEDTVFEWEIIYSSSHPTIDYTLQGTLWTRLHEDGDRSGGRSKHPDADYGNPNHPNWKRPLEFSNVYLIGNEVYGTAYIGLKKLGFWGALDVAINFIEGMEWSYDLAEKPAYLSDTPSSNDEASVEVEAKTDPIVDAVSTIQQRNDRKDFIRSGKPSVRATSKEAGQRVSGKERDEAWEQVKGE
ncbi:MAG: hypothetical protein OXL96_13890 [Candidatus Poribacteria bacterium]|nr:hypothetical protein [Candidatus Poribacteria bacterium]